MNLGKRNKVSLEFSASSMTDLIFLLLIFFMLLSTMAKNNSVIDMNLPKSSSTKTAQNKVVVSLNQNMEYFVDNKIVPKESIVPMLATKIVDKTQSRVEIAVDETIPHKNFVELVDLISVQGGYKISLQTLPSYSGK